MLRATATIDGPAFAVNAVVSGLAVYLDNWAICDLAEGDPGRRARFIATLQSGADLLFSVSNAVDLTGPQGASLDAVRSFLNEIGPRWTPVELDAKEVVDREQNGAVPSESCISRRFLKDYFNVRIADYAPNSGKIIDLSEGFFTLSAVLDWIGPQRDSIRQSMGDLDTALIDKIAGYRAKYEADARWLNETFPVLHYSAARPATSAYVNLIRDLILEFESNKLAKNDGLDFCHTVIGAAFASAAALDGRWKRRVENLPRPNNFAKTYYAPELDKMVSDIELHVKSIGDTVGPATASR